MHPVDLYLTRCSGIGLGCFEQANSSPVCLAVHAMRVTVSIYSVSLRGRKRGRKRGRGEGGRGAGARWEAKTAHFAWYDDPALDSYDEGPFFRKRARKRKRGKKRRGGVVAGNIVDLHVGDGAPRRTFDGGRVSDLVYLYIPFEWLCLRRFRLDAAPLGVVPWKQGSLPPTLISG